MAGRNIEVCNEAVAVTKSDTADNVYKYLYIGTGGNVAIMPAGGSVAVTYVGLPAGGYLWCECTKVMSTNTTASDIVGHR